MTTFDGRERAVGNLFTRDEDPAFQAPARRDRGLAGGDDLGRHSPRVTERWIRRRTDEPLAESVHPIERG